MSDPKVIYLAPKCQADVEGRLWCEDDVWSGGQADCDDPECKHMPTKYVVAPASKD